ncbi:hypothetical protein BRADI_1g29063v3 [Brachypodium distachyon]|uniref:Uncharacterized protein n=1 Tax=Brachypodium distachyon TaxID=15368 RepID=A0A2K2DLT8_BRADI|nr:hypothetical protein BRADI_1g29063v3 [Brachypodium distachyon]
MAIAASSRRLGLEMGFGLVLGKMGLQAGEDGPAGGLAGPGEQQVTAGGEASGKAQARAEQKQRAREAATRRRGGGSQTEAEAEVRAGARSEGGAREKGEAAPAKRPWERERGGEGEARAGGRRGRREQGKRRARWWRWSSRRAARVVGLAALKQGRRSGTQRADNSSSLHQKTSQTLT